MGEVQPPHWRRNPRFRQRAEERPAKIGARVAFEWGFVPSAYTRFVGLLKQAGLDPWWLDGDPDALLENYKHRDGPVDLAAFDSQVQDIATHWAAIRAIFKGHIVETVKPGPMSMPFEDLAGIVLPGWKPKQ